MDNLKNNLDFEEKVVADQVADEILTVEETEDRGLLLLIVVFLICFIFLLASLSFAIFNTYYNGQSTNVVDVGTDIVVNHNKKEEEKEKKEQQEESKKPTRKIDAGSILFSFSEQSNSIYMTDVFPTSDEVGKALTGDREYFDFNIAAKLKNINKGKIVYEISLIPIDGNTLRPEDVRVYLTENNKAVSINNNEVNTYSDLPDSKYRTNGKVIYRKTISSSSVNEYVFRMWLSHDANLSKKSKQFGCKIGVDAYYE